MIMRHKVEAIDYLRGLSIIFIIFLHTILYNTQSTSVYSVIASLFRIRDILLFSVVTVVVCSGFSLFISHKNLQLNLQSLCSFYKKRLKRLLLPWVVYCFIYVVFYAAIYFIFKRKLIDFSLWKITFYGFLAPGWLIFLFVMLTLLFPFLKYVYEKKRHLIILIILAYVISGIISVRNPTNFHLYPNINLSFISVIGLVFSYLFGWSLAYITGFFLEDLYNNHRLIKKELKITFNFIFIFIGVHILYKLFGLNMALYVNKHPPSLYYLSLSLAITFSLLSLFFAYKKYIHAHLKNFLYFFSYNSYWLFLWDALFVTFIAHIFSSLTFIHIYLRLSLQFIFALLVVVGSVILQRKAIKAGLYLEKHHF